MIEAVDVTGQTFGRWTVLGEASRRRGARYVRCACRCGTISEVFFAALRRRSTRSCGCLQRELLAARNMKHGMSNSTEYCIWNSMLARCGNPNTDNYRLYGARGIYVCERWRDSFQNFYEDMGERPAPELTLDRIDNDGPYSPENCRWATKSEQGSNTRKTRFVAFRGETLSLAEWALRTGLRRRTIYGRIFVYGWPIERALTEQVER